MLRKAVSILLAIAFVCVSLTGCASSKATEEVVVPELDGYTLLWNDEFNGNKLNMDIWNYEPHQPGWTNHELQEYTTSEDNVYVKDGKLVIKANKIEKNGRPYYTSGKVTTQNKQDFMYGKVVVSAKVPEGQGLWPAIWMMPTVEKKYGQWPKCGEVDIMEVLGSDVTKAYGTIHYGEPHAQQQGTVDKKTNNFAEAFHEYSVEWEPGEFRWYIDGEKYLTVNDWFTAVDGQDEKPYPAPFDQTFFVQMNLAVGGNWPGNPDETTDFDKAEFEIDYVRVYQKDHYKTDVKKPVVEMREPLEDGNYVRNGDFADDTEKLTDDKDWKFLLAQNGKGEAVIKDGMIEITSEAEGDVDYSVQLVSWDIPFVKGSKYKVTFDMQGHGTQIEQMTDVVSGSTISEPTPAPTADGYTFGGWYKEAACTNAWNFTADTVTANTTLYAKWTEDSADGPLCFTNVGDVTATITMQSYDEAPDITLECSKDKVTWEPFYKKEGSTITPTSVALAKGEKVYIRAENTNGAFSDENWSPTYFHVEGEGAKLAASGNIMSLLDSTCTQTEVPDYAFYCLFNEDWAGNNWLTSAPELPATKVGESSYYDMFSCCTSLTNAPNLPAEELAEACYYDMFYGCSSLETAPAVLPAETLAKNCYHDMFSDCSSLKTAPELPAESLAKACYSNMFNGCSSLETAPVLPAETLAEDCYVSMFLGCSSLESAPELPAETLAGGCYYRMFQGCTGLKSLPELPATTLAKTCYSNMFNGCTNIKISETEVGEYTVAYTIPKEGTGTLAENATLEMFTGTGGTFTGTPNINTTYYLMPATSN